MDTVKSMNGTIWVFAVILIGMVVVQSLLFLRLALKFNKRNTVITTVELRQAVKTGAISAIGPALSTVTIALSLIAMIGSATTFMRCGVIGAPAWELMMAGVSTQAAGVKFGSPQFTQGIFTLCIFGMTMASAPYFINTIITLKPLDKAVAKGTEKKKGRSFLPYLSNAAMIGILGYVIVDYLNSGAGIAAGITAAIVCYIVSKISKKINNSTLASFNMAIAMVCAMVVGQIITVVE